MVITEIASAVESVADGDFRLVRWSAVTPERSSRKIVTTRSTSASCSRSAGSRSEAPSDATRWRTMPTSSSRVAGSGRMTVVNRRLRAEDRSLTPLSRLLAVAMTLNPWTACTSVSSSGTGSVFSDRIEMRASCTSAGTRVSSSMRTRLPVCIARMTGLGTSAASDGPSASRRA